MVLEYVVKLPETPQGMADPDDSQKLLWLGADDEIVRAQIVHDMGNALTFASAAVDVVRQCIEQGASAPALLDNVGVVDEGLAGVRDLVSLLSPRSSYSPQRINLSRFVYGVGRLMQRALKKTGHELELHAQAQGEVYADRICLSRIVCNLVSNARDAMPNGGILTLKTSDAQIAQGEIPAGQYVSLAVQDEGVGISAEQMKRLFRPFYTTKKHGTGLGLVSVYNLVRKQRGYVKVASEEGQGAEFTMYLPTSK